MVMPIGIALLLIPTSTASTRRGLAGRDAGVAAGDRGEPEADREPHRVEPAALGDELDEVEVGDRQAVRLGELAVVELDHRRRHHDRHAVVAGPVELVAVVAVGLRARVVVHAGLRRLVGRDRARRLDDLLVGIARRRRARLPPGVVLDAVPVLEQLAGPVVVVDVVGVDAVGEPADLELEIVALEVAAAERGERQRHAGHDRGRIRAIDLGRATGSSRRCCRRASC